MSSELELTRGALEREISRGIAVDAELVRQRQRAEKAEAARDKLATLVRDLTDLEPCDYDHHGGCQAHGYLSLDDGERCPHDEARDVLARLVPVERAGNEA